MTPGSTPQLVRRGQRLAWLTIGWNSIEGAVAIASGAVAGSIALIGFGVDSFVEVFAGAVIVWRLAQERQGTHLSEAAERRAVKLIAGTFFVLSIGIAIESARKLIGGEHPATSAAIGWARSSRLAKKPVVFRQEGTGFVRVQRGTKARPSR